MIVFGVVIILFWWWSSMSTSWLPPKRPFFWWLFSWLWAISLSSGVRLLTSGQPLESSADVMPSWQGGFSQDLCDLCQQLFELSLRGLSTELTWINYTWLDMQNAQGQNPDSPNSWWNCVDCVCPIKPTKLSQSGQVQQASHNGPPMSQSTKWPKSPLPHR